MQGLAALVITIAAFAVPLDPETATYTIVGGAILFLFAAGWAHTVASQRAGRHVDALRRLRERYRAEFGNLKPPPKVKAGSHGADALGNIASVAGLFGLIGQIGEVAATMAGAALDHLAMEAGKSNAQRSRESLWNSMEAEKRRIDEIRSAAWIGSILLLIVLGLALGIRAGIAPRQRHAPDLSIERRAPHFSPESSPTGQARPAHAAPSASIPVESSPSTGQTRCRNDFDCSGDLVCEAGRCALPLR